MALIWHFKSKIIFLELKTSGLYFRFSFCVLTYLICVVPPIWFLELDKIDRYLEGLKYSSDNKTLNSGIVSNVLYTIFLNMGMSFRYKLLDN